MDIKKERIRINCAHCENKIVLTYHTERCPKCGQPFDPEQVKSLFHNYESQVMNSKFYQAGEKMGKAGNAMAEVGNSMQSCGCTLTLITIFIIIVLALLL